MDVGFYITTNKSLKFPFSSFHHLRLFTNFITRENKTDREREMAVSSSPCPRVFSSFECRSDPDFSASARFEKPRISYRGGASAAAFSASSTYGGISSLIFKFPPNFVRQLSIKARRNCSNIGVAQVVAASWSNNSASGSPSPAAAASATSAAAAAAAASAAPAPPVVVSAGDEEVVGVDGLNNVQLEDLADLKDESSFLSSDGSLAIHAGMCF